MTQKPLALALFAMVVPLYGPLYAGEPTSTLAATLAAPTPASTTPMSVRGISERVAEWGRVPVILELVNSEPGESRGERIRLNGKTVEQALRLIPVADPTYSWREVDGVVVVRPVDAWADNADPLNLQVKRSVWKEATVGQVFCETAGRLGMSNCDSQTFPDDVARDRVSAVGERTVLTSLIAAVRAHGSLLWELSYQRSTGNVVREFSMRVFRADGSNFGATWSRAPHSLGH